MAKHDKALFALGCFWQPDVYFSQLPGVVSTRVGYAGGTKPNPTYTDLGDHTETVEVTFDPKKVSYEELLGHFWQQHDPTVQYKTQYKSALFTLNETQKKLAEKSKITAQKKSSEKIVTEILPVTDFHQAEGYHQKYLVKCGLA